MKANIISSHVGNYLRKSRKEKHDRKTVGRIN